MAESNMTQQIIIGALSGAIFTAFVGTGEAFWLMSTTGAPDLLSPMYASILYGLIGLGIGLGAAIAGEVLGKFVPFLKNRGFGIGAAAAITPVAAFLLRYQLNKVAYAEQGVPLSTMGMIMAVLLVIDLFLIFGLPSLFKGKSPKAGLLAGIWVALTLAMAGVWISGSSSEDPAAVAHGKSIPSELSDKPNVLFLMVDTLRADHVGAYGKLEIRTPNMDSLQKDGIAFLQAISPASWTRPSGVSMFTGRIPSGHSTQTKAASVPDTAVLLTEVLQTGGVTTGGLANNINLTATFNFDQGYDTFLYEAPNYPFGGTESVFGLTFYKVLAKVMERLAPEHRVVYNYYQPADVVFKDAQSFITANGSSRWMLYAHLMEPHDPYFEHPVISGESEEDYNGVAYGRAEHEHPDPNDTEYLKKIYYQEVEFFDRELGRFLDWMKSEGHYDNTVIVLVADHGEEFNEHGGFWHGTSLYDEVIHVPLLIKTADNDWKDLKAPWQVRTIDIAPTLTALLGLDADESWEGENLLTAEALEAAREYTNPAPPVPTATEEETGDSEESDENKAPAPTQPVVSAAVKCTQERTHPLDRIVISENDFEGNVLSSIRYESFKFIVANEGNPRGLPTNELLDLESDPKELTNLSGSSESVCDQTNSKREEKLNAIMGEFLSTALQSAAHGDGAELDEATIERMRALGYME